MDTEKSIAVIGASEYRGKFGNKCVRAYLRAGWTVYPVNPGADRIEGLAVRRSVEDLPADLDRIAVYLPPPATARLLASLPQGVDVFLNPGTFDGAVLESARTLGLSVLPECAIVAIGASPSEFGE